jgi:hypothetical protein
VLKKISISAAVAGLAILGMGGVAYADSFDTDCSSHETTDQRNKGHQLIGGNSDAVVRNINGFIGGSIDRGSICPSAVNGNDVDFGHHWDGDDDD